MLKIKMLAHKNRLDFTDLNIANNEDDLDL